MEKPRIYGISFARVYPLYIAKVERKGRSRDEVDQVICWLTGYSKKGFQEEIEKQTDLKTFLVGAPKLNPLRKSITGMICGVRVEEIKEPIMQEIRYMDKLIDELARGKSMDKILRK